ncbi:MAG: hypothetical protein IJW19_00590 [Clostridia bacterium]|nr:hypothetical protein [Clostridia bacterium]
MSRKIGKGEITEYKCLSCKTEISEEDIIERRYTQSHPYGEGHACEDVCELYCPVCDSGRIQIIF